MSSRSSIVVLAALLGATACADVRRGEYWDDPEEAGPGGSGGAVTSGPADATAGTTAGDEAGSSGGTEGGPEPLSFELDVLPLLRAGCERCHSPDGQANDTRFLLLDDDVEADYAMTLDFVDLDAPAGSRLLTKGAGQGHIGGVIFDDRSSQYQTILLWIEQGALP